MPATRVDSRVLTLAVTLLLVLPVPARPRADGVGTIVDAQSGLTWMADPQALVDAGLVKRLVLPRARALAALAALDAGRAENFGHGDWRLPTARELSRFLSQASPLTPAGTDLEIPRAWLAATTLPDGRPRRASAGAPVLLWPVVGQAIAPGFSNVSLFATNSIRLKERAAVESGDVVVNDASPGPALLDNWEIALDPFAVTAPGVDLLGDSVRIKANAAVAGDVSYNELSNQGAVGGALVTPLALPVFASLPLFVSQPPAPGAADIAVPAGGFVSLPAGDYGAVTVGDGGTLLLGGVYDIHSLAAGAGADVLFTTASQVRVETRVATGKGAAIGSQDGAGVPASELVLYVAGIDGNAGALGSTPRAAEIGPANAIAANFYVPNGTLRLGQGTQASGAFLGRDVLVENRVRIALASYFFNRAPLAAGDAATVAEGGTVAVLDSGATSVLANDSDPNGDPLTVNPTPVSGPLHGSLTLAPDGTFSYTHDGSETTGDAFVYQMCDDGTPPLCATATVTVTVVPVNDPPQAVADAATVAQGGTVSQLDSGAFSVLANDSDAEGGALTVTTTPVSGPAHGSLSLAADGAFSYTQDGSENATDAFVYQMCDDGAPVECATAQVSIAVISPIVVTVVPFGTGSGQVTSSPAGIDCGAVCAASFATAAQIQLLADPDDGSVFAGFTGDADCVDGMLAPNADKTCFARFDLAAVTAELSVALTGTGSGRVTSDPFGISCPGVCAFEYIVPSHVELFAVADVGSVFVGWGGAPDCADGFLSLFAGTACSAIFDLLPPPAPTFTLSLVFTGGGSGTVTSAPPGINCDDDCSEAFPQGTTVALFARPLEGSFGGWGGDCGGTTFSTSVTLDADKTCTVSFVP